MDNASRACEIYFTRQYQNDTETKEKMIKAYKDFLGDSPVRMYKAVPEKMYVLNPSKEYKGKWIDSRKEINLKNV